MLDVLKTQRRYFVFDKNTFKHFLEKVNSLARYNVEYYKKNKVLDLYFDSPTKTLDKNNLILRKRIHGSKSTIKLKRRFVSPQFFFSDNLRKREREKDVPTSDPLSKHFYFLSNALNSMYSTPLKMDTDNLFKNMQVFVEIRINETLYKVFGSGGFKATITRQLIKIKNKETKRKANTEIIEVEMESADNTLELFEAFIARIEKHCKEIIRTTDSKFEIALRMTKPLPTKAERKLLKQQREKAAATEEQSEEG